MTSSARSLLFASFVLVSLAGCDDSTPAFWSAKNDLLAVVALEDGVAYVEKNTQTAYLLDPGDPDLRPVALPVGKAPVLAVKRNASNQLLVLCRGDQGSASRPAVPAELDVLDGDTRSATAPLVLGGRFDGLAQSNDGRFVVLFHKATGEASGGALYNPNELVIVDFTPAPLGTPAKLTQRTIRSLGGVPTGVDFLPFQDGSHHMALIEAQNYVTLLDLDSEERSEISVPLCPEGKACTFTPTKVIFDSGNLASAGKANIFVQTTSSRDIFQISLDGTTLRASLSMLTVGSIPSDMALYGAGADTRLAVLAPDTRALVIIDPSTSRTVSVTMSVSASVIVPFLLPSPSSTIARPQALLVDQGRGGTSVLFANLDTIETTGSLSLAEYPIGATATGVRALTEQGTVVIELSQSGRTGTALTVVDLASRSFSSIGAGGDLGLRRYETSGPGRLWTVDGASGLCYLNLVARPSEARLATGETWLDQSIMDILPLSKPSSDGVRHVIALHGDPDAIGNLTVLDAEKPDREHARAGYGFLLNNYLDRGQP
jgi:hypothetical protein